MIEHESGSVNPDKFGHIWDGPEGTILAVKVKTCSRCRCDESDQEALRSCDPERWCSGHVASADDPKVCAHCGVHIDSLRPPDE